MGSILCIFFHLVLFFLRLLVKSCCSSSIRKECCGVNTTRPNSAMGGVEMHTAVLATCNLR